MKEFDKIYIAKYQDFLTIRQLAEDLHVSNSIIINIQKELNERGLNEIYKNIPDKEWEKLQYVTDEKIKTKYYCKSRVIRKKVLNEILKDFNTNIIRNFPIYKYNKKYFDRDYFQEKDFENEEWIKIGILNYEISNYGRIRNIKSKKLKQLKFQKYGMQVVLWQKGKGVTITISRLVAEKFIGHVENDKRVRHINGNIRDNYYKNLEIVSK